MLYYDRIDVSEGIDVNKTSESKACDIFHYWYFLDKAFKFQPNVCDGCHDLLVMSVNLSNIAILNIKCFDHCYIISRISKNEAINLLQHADLTEKSGTLENINILFSRIKIIQEILSFRDIEIEKDKFCCYKSTVSLRDIDIDKLLRFVLVRKTTNTLLVTCMMIIKLNHCIKCFLKQALM